MHGCSVFVQLVFIQFGIVIFQEWVGNRSFRDVTNDGLFSSENWIKQHVDTKDALFSEEALSKDTAVGI
jgi:hypothetical protein